MSSNSNRNNQTWFGSFHINTDLVALSYMIKTMSLKLSEKARIRLKWMDYYRNHQNAAQTARHFGISVRTFWRWFKKYDPYYIKSLEEHSRRPKSSPGKTSPEIINLILKLRRDHPCWGREKIKLLLQEQDVHVSSRTISRVSKKFRVSAPLVQRVRHKLKPRVNRRDVKLPGDLLELDTKYVWYQGAWCFQYTLIDVVSRWRWADIYPNQTQENTISFLTQALSVTSFQIVRLQTDNGHEFQQLVTNWLKSRGIKHVFTHKRRPIENSHVERSHRSDDIEFYQIIERNLTIDQLREKFDQYINIYNHKRPHWGLGGKTPIEALKSYSLTGTTVPHVLT